MWDVCGYPWTRRRAGFFSWPVVVVELMDDEVDDDDGGSVDERAKILIGDESILFDASEADTGTEYG